MLPDIDEYYSKVYPTLREITRPAPGARQLIELAREKEWQVVLATNPLFPATATRQRLEWAGFNPDEPPFIFVTSFENMHFSKPNPAYFAEILARLGCPEEPAIVIGNDISEDILPGSEAGIPTYWITNNHADLGIIPNPGRPQGTLEDLYTWLSSIDPESLHPDFSTVPAILSQMPATPAMFSTLAGSLADKILNRRPSEGEWSITEIFCHLRDVECEVNLPRLGPD